LAGRWAWTGRAVRSHRSQLRAQNNLRRVLGSDVKSRRVALRLIAVNESLFRNKVNKSGFLSVEPNVKSMAFVCSEKSTLGVS